jgi:proline-specific peptidase
LSHDTLSTGEHTVIVREVNLWYHVKGQGPPLLLLPGGSGWGGDILPYIETLSPLEITRTVIYLEPRGIGRSERLVDHSLYSMDEQVEDIEALRIHFGLDKIAIAAHSGGGFVALKYAIKYPNKVERLLLLGTGPTLKLGDVNKWESKRRGSVEKVEGYKRLEAMNLPKDEFLLERMKLYIPVWHFHDYVLGVEVVEKYISRMRTSWDPYIYFVESEWSSFDLRGELGVIDCPCLIVIGDDDVLPIILVSEEFNEELPNSELVVISDCGHFMWIEQPETFFKQVLPFLS